MTSDDDVQLRRLSPRSIAPAEPSPARDALRVNLRASEDEHGLKKRKSWFGSMRDVFHKGALQAKAAVDSMRGDGSQMRSEDESPMMETNRSPCQSSVTPECGKSPYHSSITPEPRESLDSAASTTPLKSHTFSPQLNRRRTFSPREAVSSLRQHLHGHGSRNKRGSVYTIIGRNSTDAPDPAGPEQFTSPSGRDGGNDVEHHGRKNSVASSLVGSIRGLARRNTKSKATAPMEPTNMPADPAEETPLPSSPVNIPSAAPVLGLDLGMPGMNFMPVELPGAAENVRDEDTRKLQDPANFGIGGGGHQRKISLPLVPNEVKMQYTHPAVKQRPATPGDMLLKLPSESLRHSPPAAPATPLPGTNLSMELNGTGDSASSGKKSTVFERSVTPTTQKDRKELRSMCSLDAIADACSTTRKNSVPETCETVHEEIQHRLSPDPGVLPKSNPFSTRVSILSASTVSTCPSDMPELERQKARDSQYYHFGTGGQAGTTISTPPIPIEDPFDDRNVASHGPPSPVRSVKLPLRLKIKGPSDDSAANVDVLHSSPTPVTDQDDLRPSAQYRFQTPPKWKTPSEDSNDYEQRLQRNYTVPQNSSNIVQRPVSPLSPEQTEILSDDTLTRAQSLWNSDVVYPGYDDYRYQSDEASSDCCSPHGGPMVPAPLSHGEATCESSPGKSTWKAGLGSESFKFSIDTWRPTGTQPLPGPQPQLTPNRRAMDISIDSVSVDETFETPPGSRASTKSGRTPSMGNKLELDTRRSERNMRYNALHQEQQEERKSSSPVRMHARFVFGGSSGDMDPNEAQYFPEYSTATPGRRTDTPDKSKQQPARVNSEDSMTMSLRSASDNMERLRALLGEIESDDEKGGEEIVDAFTTASSPRSKRSVGQKDHDVRSDTPSPEPRPHRVQTTPVIGPVAVSATPTHDMAFHNRFTVLDVGIDIISSPGSDDTAIADLPASASHQHHIDSKENRVGSGDTLDQTLNMLSSPGSGYRADESSDVQTPGSGGKQIPRRYRSQSARKGRKVLGEVAGNT